MRLTTKKKNREEIKTIASNSKEMFEYVLHISDILIDPNKTFENFIIGPSNNIACATAKAVANTKDKEKPAVIPSSVVLAGPWVGRGGGLGGWW